MRFRGALGCALALVTGRLDSRSIPPSPAPSPSLPFSLSFSLTDPKSKGRPRNPHPSPLLYQLSHPSSPCPKPPFPLPLALPTPLHQPTQIPKHLRPPRQHHEIPAQPLRPRTTHTALPLFPGPALQGPQAQSPHRFAHLAGRVRVRDEAGGRGVSHYRCEGSV